VRRRVKEHVEHVTRWKTVDKKRTKKNVRNNRRDSIYNRRDSHRRRVQRDLVVPKETYKGNEWKETQKNQTRQHRKGVWGGYD